MPKFYCEYCQVSLAHSSAGGRRQHNSGKKHIMNKIEYWQHMQKTLALTVPSWETHENGAGFSCPDIGIGSFVRNMSGDKMRRGGRH